MRDSPARDAVDWDRVDLWWGDERFLAAGDPERDETKSREALPYTLPLDPARVHPMPAADKARAVGLALAGRGAVQVPAAGVRWVDQTFWLLDRAAASEVSPRLRRLR